MSPASRAPAPVAGKTPWYRRTLRWGQTNITEIDPTRYDVGWWRTHTEVVMTATTTASANLSAVR